jgi:hypothetical protein
MINRYSAEDEQFFRSMMFPEEERSNFTSAKWDGSFRWFRAPNVICLEHYRRQPAAPIPRTKPAA